ncbi:MAG: hypothetical protein FWH22_06220 [Fibromonadales bacterium]|nr:hypothetical protein [Fibromonadales bacterium]
MRIKYLLAIILAVLFSQQSVYASKFNFDELVRKRKIKDTAEFSVWPIFYAGGTFFFTELEVEQHYPGYTLSGGLTLNMHYSEILFFTDALYSHRAYDGVPGTLNYRIEETSIDLAIGAGLNGLYIGGYAQFPMQAKIRVNEWTWEDFDGLTRNPSLALIGGYRRTGKYLGIDARILLGQGPGQFLRNSFGNNFLGQISLGFMGGF